MNEFMRDIAFAWRGASRNPATSLLIVATLALGIGLNSAVFSVTWRVLLAPLPYTDSEQLVLIEQQKPGSGLGNVRWSGPTVEDLRTMSTTLADVARYEQQEHGIAGSGDTVAGKVGVASWNLFPLLGVGVQLGRDFTRADDAVGAEPVILLSHEFWQSKFGGDPAVIGATLELTDIVYRIVGVLPAMPAWPHANEVWVTQAGDPYRAYNLTGAYEQRFAQAFSHVAGRMKEGVTLAELEQNLDAIARRLVAAYPDVYTLGYALDAQVLDAEMTRASRATFLLLAGLAFLVVLIASANVASLNLARLAQRNQELAVREAVGAAPGRIVRQLLSESLLFAFAGALCGLLVAWPALQLLARFAAGYSPLADSIHFDHTLLFCALGTALLTALLSGLGPSFTRRELTAALKEGGTRATLSRAGMRYRKALMLLQFALAFAVLTSAALMLLSLRRLDAEDTGYDAESVLALSVSLYLDFRAGDYPGQMQRFGRQLLDQVQALPGVVSAGIYTGVPMLEDAAFIAAFPIAIEGREAADRDANPLATFRFVTENYFSTLGIPLLQGRMFTSEDTADSVPVAIVNASAARLFPGGNAIGGRVRWGQSEPWREVVGVVAEVRASDLDSVEGPVLYNSFWQHPAETLSLYVKTLGDPNQLAAAVAAIVQDIDPDQAVTTLKPLAELRQDWLAPARLRAVLIVLSGLLALSVTLAGVVGVVGYSVSQRLQEIGIRMAVGATPTRVTRLFVADSLKICAGGIALGLMLMLAVAPLLQPLLYATDVGDAGAYVGSALILTLAALVASWLPAGKAGALSPTLALRAE